PAARYLRNRIPVGDAKNARACSAVSSIRSVTPGIVVTPYPGVWPTTRPRPWRSGRAMLHLGGRSRRDARELHRERVGAALVREGRKVAVDRRPVPVRRGAQRIRRDPRSGHVERIDGGVLGAPAELTQDHPPGPLHDTEDQRDRTTGKGRVEWPAPGRVDAV